jgi:hypothetical protein
VFPCNLSFKEDREMVVLIHTSEYAFDAAVDESRELLAPSLALQA